MRYLLDTNVLSELRKGRLAAPTVQAWSQSVPGARQYTSVLVLGEIRRGIERERRRDPAKAVRFDHWLATVLAQFEDRILAVDCAIADLWGHLGAGDPLPQIDGLIAATAIVHDMVLVTRNVADMSRTGARLLDPFATR